MNPYKEEPRLNGTCAQVDEMMDTPAAFLMGANKAMNQGLELKQR